MTQNYKQIYVPALIDGNLVKIPEFWLCKDIEYKSDSNGMLFSAAEYLDYNPPTLAELRHAYFDKNLDGSWISPDYRVSVLSKKSYGEWVSTFFQDGRRIIERPERVIYNEKHELWIAEGGRVTPVEPPPNGWVLEYDKTTDFPSKTSRKRKDAEQIFDDDSSYFYRSVKGLKAIFLATDIGPFYIDASHNPDHAHLFIGIRICHRSEQNKKFLATLIHS